MLRILLSSFIVVTATIIGLPATASGQSTPEPPVGLFFKQVDDGDCFEDASEELQPSEVSPVPQSDSHPPLLFLPGMAPQSAETLRPAAPSATSPGRRRLEKQQQYESIQSALKRLRSELKYGLKPAPVDSQIAGQSIPGEIGVPHADPAPPRPPGIPVVPPLAPMIARDTETPNETLPESSRTPVPVESEREDLFGLDGIPLVDGPVDRLALADNFYAEKEFAIALHMYREVRISDLSMDQQYWVQFQQASCLRRLGDLVAARKAYRILAGRKDGGWLAGMSTWWLNRIEERVQLEEQLAQVEVRLAELKESDNEPEKL